MDFEWVDIGKVPTTWQAIRACCSAMFAR